MGRATLKRPNALRLYIVGISFAAMAVLVVCIVAVHRMPDVEVQHWAPYALFFIGVGWLTSSRQVYFTESNAISMGDVGQIATLICLPLSIALLCIGVSKFLSEGYLRIRKARQSWRAVAVNVGSRVLTNGAAGLAFHALNGDHFLWSHDTFSPILAVPALVAMAGLYHLISTLLITIPVTLNSGERPVSVYRQISRDALGPELSLMAVGVILAVLFQFSHVLSFLIVVPVYLSMRSFAAVARLRQETIEAVLKMAESIDYRDTGTYEHSERLADFCRRLATALGLTPEHVREVVLASRVHDLGKIGISNDILLKQGPLTREERTIMEEHPIIGANILASYSSFRESVDIVRHHHERWDGRGYPDNLKGEEVPVGSRIISVVDAFDAMTSDRPYRRAMSASDAVERLKDGIGSQFDPRVTACFIQLLIEEGTYIPHDSPLGLHIVASEAG
jgi:HD domain